MNAETAIHHYSQAYQQLYQRQPRHLRALDQQWIVMNGARLRADELNALAQYLSALHEQQVVEEKRSVVQRLINWFKK